MGGLTEAELLWGLGFSLLLHPWLQNGKSAGLWASSQLREPVFAPALLGKIRVI